MTFLQYLGIGAVVLSLSCFLEMHKVKTIKGYKFNLYLAIALGIAATIIGILT